MVVSCGPEKAHRSCLIHVMEQPAQIQHIECAQHLLSLYIKDPGSTIRPYEKHQFTQETMICCHRILRRGKHMYSDPAKSSLHICHGVHKIEPDIRRLQLYRLSLNPQSPVLYEFRTSIYTTNLNQLSETYSREHVSRSYGMLHLPRAMRLQQ